MYIFYDNNDYIIRLCRDYMPISSLTNLLERRKKLYQEKFNDILNEVYNCRVHSIEQFERYIDSLARCIEENTLDARLENLPFNESGALPEKQTSGKSEYKPTKRRKVHSSKNSPTLTFKKYSRLRDMGLRYGDIRKKYPDINYRTIVAYGMGYSRKNKA